MYRNLLLLFLWFSTELLFIQRLVDLFCCEWNGGRAERAADQIECERMGEGEGGPRFLLPAYIKHPGSGCQSADILHKFQWFQEKGARSRLSRWHSRAPDRLSSLSFGAARNKSLGSLPGLTGFICTHKISSLIFKTYFLPTKTRQWCLWFQDKWWCIKKMSSVNLDRKQVKLSAPSALLPLFKDIVLRNTLTRFLIKS